MLQNIRNLTEIKTLTKKEQSSITGGKLQCAPYGYCIEYSIHCAEIECRIIL